MIASVIYDVGGRFPTAAVFLAAIAILVGGAALVSERPMSWLLAVVAGLGGIVSAISFLIVRNPDMAGTEVVQGAISDVTVGVVGRGEKTVSFRMSSRHFQVFQHSGSECLGDHLTEFRNRRVFRITHRGSCILRLEAIDE